MGGQLEPGTLPTDGLARGLASSLLGAQRLRDEEPLWDLLTFHGTGEVPAGLLAELDAIGSAPATVRDSHGYLADHRALRAYVADVGTRGAVEGWQVQRDDRRVPWAWRAPAAVATLDHGPR